MEWFVYCIGCGKVIKMRAWCITELPGDCDAADLHFAAGGAMSVAMWVKSYRTCADGGESYHLYTRTLCFRMAKRVSAIGIHKIQ